VSAHAYTETERLRETFAGREQRVAGAERRGEMLVGGAFLAAATALIVLAHPNHEFSLPLAGAYVAGLALVGLVRFDIGAGFTVPTQALFVPMLFAVPIPLVPALVCVALALGMLPSVLSGRAPASRLLTVPANCWFAVGPAVVFAIAGEVNPSADVGVLLAALAAQFLCDFLASAARERIIGGITVAELAAEVSRVYLFDLALAPLGLAVAIGAAGRQWVALLIAPLFGVLRWFSVERRARIDQLIELNDAYRGTALVLGDVVEADDTYTGEHCKDVVQLALAVARELGLGPDQQRVVEFGALLHDIGKIAVPKEIVNKPGKLDPGEWEIIKTHTLEGQRMLERVGGFMGSVGWVVRSHHERWDGGGYPDGLRGEQIPLASRIISCCDAFNAMTTTRSYRGAMPISTAVAELEAGAGGQFDPHAVRALLRVVAEELV
jgi:putative nucleotidyltransferase with HDIG domain